MNGFYGLLRLCFVFALSLGAPVYVVAQDAKEIVERNIEPKIGFRKSVGIVVGVMTRDGQRVYAYGKAGGERNEALNGDSVFEIGSIGKVFTTIVLADMVERWELSLSDTAGQFLPGDVKAPKYQNTPITLLDLATHTSGLPRRPANLNPKEEHDPYAGYTVSQMYQFLSEYKLERGPGARYEYSNVGFGLLGHVLALKAGANYEDLVLSRICAPLGMTSTRLQLSPELQARLARGHNIWGNPVPNWNIPEAIAGAGGFRSTVNDLLKFLAANLERAPPPLLPAIRNTHSPRRKTNSEGTSIGLGWNISQSNGLEIIGHNGQTGGYASYLGFIKKRQIGVIVLANFNLGDDAAEVGFRLLEQLATALAK